MRWTRWPPSAGMYERVGLSRYGRRIPSERRACERADGHEPDVRLVERVVDVLPLRGIAGRRFANPFAQLLAIECSVEEVDPRRRRAAVSQ